VETLGCIPTAPASYRKPPPLSDEPADPQADASTARRRPRQRRRSQDDADQQDPALPRLPEQSFAIEHRVREKKNKFRPFLGADVDNPRRFVPFMLEASGRLGTAAGAFLEYLRTLCHFPILRFRRGSLSGVPPYSLSFPNTSFPCPRECHLR
jgi:hypothetical protein